MSSLFAFPGQGAQQAGMLHQLPAETADCLQEASAALGEDVLALDTPRPCNPPARCSCACWWQAQPAPVC